jgi:NADPH2:quinone reductase
MYAVRIHEHGDPAVLTYEEVPLPEPEQGQVRVNIAAAGVNFIDTYHRTGLYPVQLPFTPGVEAAGTIDALGPEVSGFQEGEHVAFTMTPGAYAEYAVVPASNVIHVPAELDLPTAAASLLQGMTAHYLTNSSFPLKPGDTVLVHAAAGATGQLIVQMAKQLGARVFGTASSAEKGAIAIQRGADEIIIYTQKDFVEEVKRLTDGAGVDVVYDSVGATTFEKSLDCLRPRGMLVSFGQSSGAIPLFNVGILGQKGSLSLVRPSLAHYIATREELEQRSSDVFNGILDGTLTITVAKTLPLAQAAAAHELLQDRSNAGKILLTP